MTDNITDWALEQYQTVYQDNVITKEDIFYYTYGVLHSPGFRKKYQAFLTKGITNVPMAPDFWAFSKAGRKLADLHLNYETCERYKLGKPLNPIPNNPDTIKFGRKPNSGPGPKTMDDQTILIVGKAQVFDNLPICNYKVNGNTPVGWLTWTPKPSKAGINRAPFRHMSGADIHAMVERLVYVGVESDKIIDGLPKEFEGMEPASIQNNSETESTTSGLVQQTFSS